MCWMDGWMDFILRCAVPGIEEVRLDISIIFRFLETELVIYRWCVETCPQGRNTRVSKWVRWTHPLLLVEGYLQSRWRRLSRMVGMKDDYLYWTKIFLMIDRLAVQLRHRRRGMYGLPICRTAVIFKFCSPCHLPLVVLRFDSILTS